VAVATASTKRKLALGLGLALIALTVLVGATSGFGLPSVPDGSVAIVADTENGEVSEERYGRALEQASAQLGLRQPPERGDEQFEQVNNSAMENVLLAIWVEGEVADRGLSVSDEDVQSELDQIEESFSNKREFARVVRQARFCTEEELESDVDPIECEDVQRQARLLALQRVLTDSFAVEPEISDDEVELFYEANIESFEQPASRDVRVILNEDEGEVDSARQELEGVSLDDEDYEETWDRIAGRVSQDQASKDRGGLLQDVVEGQGDPALDEQIFSAEVGELVGPFETDRGFYLIQVVEETPASTQSLEEASEAIRQQLTAARQQAAQAELQNSFIEKWTARTNCAEEVAMQLCADFDAPEPEPIPGAPEQPEPPPVQSSSPIEPGSATPSIDGSTQTGLPQGPFVPPPEEGAVDPATGLPPGAEAIGPGGAPPGGAPPGGAPPGGAPPGTAPAP
jgi:peptidyl-prolyl cis-trans isomerase C